MKVKITKSYIKYFIYLCLIIGVYSLYKSGTGYFKNTFFSSSLSPAQSKNTLDYKDFAKGWWHHGFDINIDSNGQGEADWRVYKWCSEDPTPPCDGMQGNNIIDGGKAIIKLSSVAGKTASGQVISSNDPTIKVGSITLTVLPYDMLQLTQGKDTLMLCGPDFAKLAPASVLKSEPCGA